MNTTDKILGEATTPRQKRTRKVRPPTEKELTTPHWAFNYARYDMKGRFPEGEAALAKSPQWAHYYAKYVIKGRFPEAEEAIAKSPDYAKLYLEQFPEAKLEWAMNGWIDWLDL